MTTCAVVGVESREFTLIGMRAIGPPKVPVAIVIARIGTLL